MKLSVSYNSQLGGRAGNRERAECGIEEKVKWKGGTESISGSIRQENRNHSRYIKKDVFNTGSELLTKLLDWLEEHKPDTITTDSQVHH